MVTLHTWNDKSLCIIKGWQATCRKQLSRLWMERAPWLSTLSPHRVLFPSTNQCNLLSTKKNRDLSHSQELPFFSPCALQEQDRKEMATWVISECGRGPLPRIYPRPHRRTPSTQSRISLEQFRPSYKQSLPSFRTNWALNASTPHQTLSTGLVGDEGEAEFFDPAAPPPFKLSDIRDAIPQHCWVKDPWRSMSYVVRDVAVVFGLASVTAYLNSWAVWPLYWFAQGTMFWALFVLGHDWWVLQQAVKSTGLISICFL